MGKEQSAGQWRSFVRKENSYTHQPERCNTCLHILQIYLLGCEQPAGPRDGEVLGR